MKIGDQVFRAVLDTGATLSIVARRLLKTFKKTKTPAIGVGDGRTEAVWGASPIPAARPVALCSSGFFLG